MNMEGGDEGIGGTDGIDIDDSESNGASESDGADSEGDSDGNNGGAGFPDDSDGAGETGSDLNCGGDSVVVDVTPANLMLVLDKSGSMTSNSWDHDGNTQTGDVTRWYSLHQIVEGIADSNEDAMSMGAVLFPAADAGGNGADASCQMADSVEVPLAAHNATAIMDGIPAENADTHGGTPAREGILAAMNHFSDLDPVGSRAIVLVTDGAANCVPGVDAYWSHYDDELELAVSSARQDLGISTYVVGIDIADEVDGQTGVNVHDELSAVANAGGVGRDGSVAYYPAADHSALQAALEEISSRVQCTVHLDALPAHPDYVDVWVGDEAIGQVDSCADGDGWRFTSDSAPYDTIELCGAACDAFQDAGTLDADYRCPPAK
jgi:hypothetical protein